MERNDREICFLLLQTTLRYTANGISTLKYQHHYYISTSRLYLGKWWQERKDGDCAIYRIYSKYWNYCDRFAGSLASWRRRLKYSLEKYVLQALLAQMDNRHVNLSTTWWVHLHCFNLCVCVSRAPIDRLSSLLACLSVVQVRHTTWSFVSHLTGTIYLRPDFSQWWSRL